MCFATANCWAIFSRGSEKGGVCLCSNGNDQSVSQVYDYKGSVDTIMKEMALFRSIA